MSGEHEHALTACLVEAAEYGVAKAVALGLISCDPDAVRVIARAATHAVVDELASREEQLREVAPPGETETTRDGHSVRIMEYRNVTSDLKEEA